MASVLKKSNTAQKDGFIPISRKLFDNFLWKEKREFSRAEAWLDLIQLARFEASSTKEVINGQVVEYGLGERPLSLRLLADRWQWSKNRVDKFLDLLVSERMIMKRTAKGTGSGTDEGTAKRTGQTVISICNYASYNVKPEMKGQQKGQSEGQQAGQVAGQSRDNINKENKYNIPLTHVREEVVLGECYNALLNCQSWWEVFCMNNRLKPDQFAGYLKQFFCELQDRGETMKSEKDAKFHFSCWFKIEIEKQKKQQKQNETDWKPSKTDKARQLYNEYEAINNGESPFANGTVLPDL